MRQGLSLNLGFVGFGFFFSAKLEARKPPLVLSLLLPEMGSQACAGQAASVVLSPSSGPPDCTASTLSHSAILWQSPNLGTYTGNTTMTYYPVVLLWCPTGPQPLLFCRSEHWQ